MAGIAFVFSGQGAQKPGMARAFYETNPRVRRLFDEAEGLRPGTLEACFSGPVEALKKTEVTQPCLYLADLASAMALEDAGIKPEAAAGFSLGELPALAFAGAFDYLAGFQLACRRGELMAAEAAKAPAGMLAVLKLEDGAAEALCARFSHVWPVNYNCPGQVAVAGLADQLEAFKADVRAAGGRAMPLAVSGGFHSPLMDAAARGFGEVLRQAKLQKPALETWSNYTGEPYGEDVAGLLEAQVNHPVRWSAAVGRMAARGIGVFIETGVGDVLKKLCAKIAPEALCLSVEGPEDLIKMTEELKRC